VEPEHEWNTQGWARPFANGAVTNITWFRRRVVFGTWVPTFRISLFAPYRGKVVTDHAVWGRRGTEDSSTYS
jgi:hypothetical protein